MSGASVQRHRTAMVRHSLSKPVSLMVQHGIVRPEIEVFDYGCGQGDDLRALAAAGVPSFGWDPHFAPDAERRSTDVVNLGFVLNVIEDEHERQDALLGAWSLARRVLCVSTMIAGQVPTDGLKPYRDGFLTRRGTFQKYFQHSELRDLIRQTTKAEPVALAPAIFLLFRRGEDEEEFLLRRRMGRRASTSDYRASSRQRAPRPVPLALAERIPISLAAIADAARLRGRLPHPDELPSAALDELASAHVSLSRAMDCCLAEVLGAGELEAAAAGMREDLLVHYALGRLNRSRTASKPSPAMVRDIRAHFGSQRELEDQSVGYLMSLADPSIIAGAISKTIKAQRGAADEKQRLIIDVRSVGDLPAVLRLYLGCAAYFAGEPDDNMLIRFDPARKRVAYLPLADRRAALPIAEGMVLIDLARQTVIVTPAKRILLGKSRLMKRPNKQQREAEASFRTEHGIGEAVLLHRLGPP